MESIRSKISIINNFLINSNCSDFRVKDYDGCNLLLVGSFDLCYYHEIEIIFYEVFHICMDTTFFVDLIEEPVRFSSEIEKMIEVTIIDGCKKMQSIICENIDCTIKRVKYFDDEGNRII